MKKTLNRVASAPKKVTSHVYRNRGRYCLAAGFIAGGVTVRNLDNDTYKEAIAFIEQKGLSSEFFLSPEDFAELAS
jgi:hypothetical protein